MKTPPKIRPAAESDLPAILGIYNDAVENTTAIWNETPADLANRKTWFMERTSKGFPVLVAEREGVIGYGSFGDFRPFMIFNVADACITIGVLLLVARALLLGEKAGSPDGQPSAE